VAQQQDVTNEVRAFMNDVARDVTQNGVTAWRKHFEDSPSFFMAVNGEMVFPDSQSFTQGMPNLARTFKRIDLKWGEEIRVDPLTVRLASVGTAYHEELAYVSGIDGGLAHAKGFFTALAEKRGEHWQFRNVHWSASIPAPIPAAAASSNTKEK
jgi:hypothetical protein